MKQGENYQRDMPSSSALQSRDRPSLRTGRSHIYEKAFALSRSTSVRKRPTQEMDPEQDNAEDDDDGEYQQSEVTTSQPQRHNSINLLGSFAASSSSPIVDDGPGPQRFQDSSHSPSLQRRGSGDLLGNAFRSSIASDASFNTITGQQDRESIMYGGANTPIHPGLFRRDSMDTVRSSEFDEGGRWGRAWSGRTDDEESLYGGSEWGSSDADMDSSSQWLSTATQGATDDYPEQLRSPTASGSGSLDALRKLTQGHGLDGLTLSDVPKGRTGQYESHDASKDASALAPSTELSPSHLRPSAGRERIVSLTPSIHGLPDSFSPTTTRSSVRDSTSTVRQMERPSRRESVDSVSTIGAGQTSDDEAAHVVVWPPTPAGSEVSHGPSDFYNRGIAPDAASIHEWEAVSDEEEENEKESESQTAAAPTAPVAAEKPAPESEVTGPATISSMLARGQAPTSSPDVRDNRKTSSEGPSGRRGGHPAGRAPPPLPMVGRYEDPNGAVPRGGLGRARAAAIAAADGRESIVSDLDVETLRLDSESRRDSSSSLRSRMSVGTVRYDDLDLDGRRGPMQFSSPPLTATKARRSLSQNSTAEDATPIASATSMSRNASQPVHATSIPRPPMANNGSAQNVQRSAIANHASSRSLHSAASTNTLSPPTAMRPQVSQSSMRSASSTVMSGSGKSVTISGQDTRTGPSSAENYLTQGISYHEQGDLSRSAYYFERSAKVDGGCVVGMCMWGMTLREGWGARKDPRKGFEWIQRAAAKAGELMQSSHRRSEAELKAVRSELKLSVYELGKCYCYGWGIKMDKRMALEYFELAAKLGDADAQAEAGALFAAGKGCKKDLKKAAKYYRMAAAQGYDLIGLSWVWKPKFDD